ncbi:very-long-chain (3R)-3-hydroxyacyl-CoA dehydratase 4 isoform X2 [Takifugu flavidus]|uniref:very-long-chain (3R)-3-hydroxyacyl-CoA dehydratase 4 isoform X2 n=1 Tax=Takifugu flavidus TaxID=433684 RepID=UPI002544391D|nr:very-long-chain (3R)-3-hydroxyacyl-CoA dehydratase 4 isoform X2 [Takifugu flavidus]
MAWMTENLHRHYHNGNWKDTSPRKCCQTRTLALSCRRERRGLRFPGKEQKPAGGPGFGGRMVSFRTVYIVSYNLLQFCVHSWILTNIIIRILRFGRDALADMFYSIGFATSLCQLFSILELYHIADGIEKARLLPRFIQVVERSSVLVMVIVLEEFQIKPVVSLLFFLWNIVELLRCDGVSGAASCSSCGFGRRPAVLTPAPLSGSLPIWSLDNGLAAAQGETTATGQME